MRLRIDWLWLALWLLGIAAVALLTVVWFDATP